MKEFQVNIRPGSSILGNYKNQSYKIESAFAEFIDNSTQSFFSHKEEFLQIGQTACNISIEIYPEYIKIYDNAYGMEIDDFKRALKLDSPPEDKSGRCEKGMGLKTSATCLGSLWSVETTQKGSKNKYKAVVDEQNLKCYKDWHTDFFNKHDFEIDERTKVEVKTTSKEIRKHSFSYDQICRNKLNVFVISCSLKLCEKGLSLYELCKNTMSLLKDNKQILAIELLMTKLGLNEDYQGVNCIPEETYSSIKIYNAKDIPSLCKIVPECISNIHYDVDFSNIKEDSFENLRR